MTLDRAYWLDFAADVACMDQSGPKLRARIDVGAYPIAGPWITDKEIRYVNDAVANGWYANSAKYQGEFERHFSAFTGRAAALRCLRARRGCTSR